MHVFIKELWEISIEEIYTFTFNLFPGQECSPTHQKPPWVAYCKLLVSLRGEM